MSAPVILESCSSLLGRYDVLLCDVWGVVHDGRVAFAGANAVLAAFRERGGTVVLVSNAPTPSDNVARVLDEKGVVRDAWDAIVTSGDLALAHVRRQGWQRIHHIGPARRERAFFSALGNESVPVGEAEGITVTGLVDDRRETAEHYRERLLEALDRDIELVCANPDLVVHVGPDLLPCAGAIGALYEEMGGRVLWAGKPFPIAYDTGLAEAQRFRGVDIDKARVLAIGDSVRTDLAAAAGAGIDALFIFSGIHRDEAMPGGAVSAEGVARLLAGSEANVIASAAALTP
jgi:HAD superfamily hydrolase (TIGR01459 family)